VTLDRERRPGGHRARRPPIVCHPRLSAGPVHISHTRAPVGAPPSGRSSSVSEEPGEGALVTLEVGARGPAQRGAMYFVGAVLQGPHPPGRLS